MKHFVNPDVPFRDTRRELIESIALTCGSASGNLYKPRARPERDSHACPFARHLSIKRSSAFAFNVCSVSESTAQEVLLTRSTRRAAVALGIAETYELEFSPYRLRPRHRSDTIDRPPPISIMWHTRRSALGSFNLPTLLTRSLSSRRYMRYQAGHRIIITIRPRVSFTRYAPTRLNFVLILPTGYESQQRDISGLEELVTRATCKRERIDCVDRDVIPVAVDSREFTHMNHPAAAPCAQSDFRRRFPRLREKSCEKVPKKVRGNKTNRRRIDSRIVLIIEDGRNNTRYISSANKMIITSL